MSETTWTVFEGQQPIAATAIHDGHALRDDVRARMALAPSERLREEDPGTGIIASVAGTQILVHRSRFEVDLNRPRETAVYVTPEQAWGLEMWAEPLPQSVIDESLAIYDAFYAEAHRVFTAMEQRFGYFVVLDVHSYNHRRGGPDAAPDSPADNPEVNVGTGSLNREKWGTLVDRVMVDLRATPVLGRTLDVRENVRFQGGHFSRWIHQNFPDSACCLALEFKKTFMDEWTGKFFPEDLEALTQALADATPGIYASLHEMGCE